METPNGSRPVREHDRGRHGRQTGATLRASPDAVHRLQTALATVREGKRAQCRGIVRACLTQHPDDAVAQVIAAGLAFVTRDYQDALDSLARAETLEPRLLHRVVDDHFRYAGRLGWDQEVRESLERAMVLQPDEPRWPVLAMRLFMRADAPERALEMAHRALALVPNEARLRMEVAHLLLQSSRYEEATAAARQALASAPSEDRGRFIRGAALAYADAGDFPAAIEAFEEALESEPGAVEIHHELAELALARGDGDGANRHATRADAVSGPTPASSRVRGAAAMLGGHIEVAIEHFERALAADPDDYVALVWRAEAAMHQGESETAHDLLTRATMRAPGYFVAARIVRFLVVAADDADDLCVPAHLLEEMRSAVKEMVPDATEMGGGATTAAVCSLLREALRRMAGNRTVRTTFLDSEGELHRIRTRTGVRHASRRALQWIRTFSPEVTLAALDEVCARHPHASLPICHRGELHLWLGDLEAARRDLWGAIERHRWTRWAYIGLAGVELMQGHPGNALMTSAHGVATMGGTVGPAVFVYRGEAHLQRGEFERAREDLEMAVEQTPTRVGAWVDLALVYDALGDAPAFDRAWARLDETAPGLLAEAATASGVTLFRDPGDEPTRDETRAVLESALKLMRGNRSTTCATFFTPGGKLRFVQPFSNQGVAVHAGDAEVLERVERALRDGIGTEARRTPTGGEEPGGSEAR